MDEILIRAACPEDAADIAEIATQPQVVWGRCSSLRRPWRDGRYVDSLVMGRLRPDMAHE
jgi:hypothetical protein